MGTATKQRMGSTEPGSLVTVYYIRCLRLLEIACDLAVIEIVHESLLLLLLSRHITAENPYSPALQLYSTKVRCYVEQKAEK